MTREQKIAQAQRLRNEGLAYREIAKRVGVSFSTAHRWLNPDYAERQRKISREAKKRRQIKDCIDCGAKLAYDRQHNDRCQRCQHEHDYGERNARIFAAWERGEDAPTIAAREGLTSKAVSSLVDHHRRLYGKPLPLHRERNRHLWDEIEPLWREGLTSAEIGERVGLSGHDVQSRVQQMRAAGIDLPHRNRRKVAA